MEPHLSIGFVHSSRLSQHPWARAARYTTRTSARGSILSYFEHSCYLHCTVPRSKTRDGRAGPVPVPWARENSGFTLLIEALVMALIEREMLAKRMAEIMRVYAQRIWTVFDHRVCDARRRDDP